MELGPLGKEDEKGLGTGVRSIKLSVLSQAKTYDCQFDWPENVSVQAGDSGIVLAGSGSYTTAFFEAFPPDTFVRGEGQTVAKAERDAWEQFSKIRRCTHPEFERRGYENGVGFCKVCGMFKSDAFLPTKTCQVCGAPTYYTLDVDGNAYCEEHLREKPLEKWTTMDWEIAYSEYHVWLGQRALDQRRNNGRSND